MALLAGIVGPTVLGVVATAQTGEPLWLFLSLPFTLLLFVVLRLAPTGYRLDPQGLAIDRRAGAKLIPYRRIRGVDREERTLAGVSVTASKGVFGTFGRFWGPGLGVYRLYLSNRDQVVWLDTEDGWVGISPDRPDEFVERLTARLSLLRG